MSRSIGCGWTLEGGHEAKQAFEVIVQHNTAPLNTRDLLEAELLQDLWCSLSLKHVSLEGGRCSCGRAHATLRLADFEEDIGEYLYDDAARGQRQDINAFLRAYGRDAETGRWNIDRLVRLLAQAQPEHGLTVEIRAELVAKLRPIIESFDRLHV